MLSSHFEVPVGVDEAGEVDEIEEAEIEEDDIEFDEEVQ